MSAVARFMFCKKPWKLTDTFTLAAGHIVTIDVADFDSGIALLHLGGMLRHTAPIEQLFEHTRIAEPEEIRKDLRFCPSCDKVELGKDGEKVWMERPPCFRPREGVRLIPYRCPSCDA